AAISVSGVMAAALAVAASVTMALAAAGSAAAFPARAAFSGKLGDAVAQFAHGHLPAIVKRHGGIELHELKGGLVATHAHARFGGGRALGAVDRMARALAGQFAQACVALGLQGGCLPRVGAAHADLDKGA